MRLYLLLLVFLPFIGALVLAVAGTSLPRRVVEWIACGTVLGALVMAVLAFLSAGGGGYRVVLFRWIAVEGLEAAMEVFYNPLAAVMALMVTFVSSLIHLYSVGFMRDEEGYVRYFCYLNLFVFAMLTVTLADNLLFLYLGWEGVGFCSYALIGFWYANEVNAAAGRKAFMLTRIGDVAFGAAIGYFFLLFSDLSLSAINGRAASLGPAEATILGFLLLWAAVGKSAQLPLAVWLPDAMAGPTPVSALIHAATMVTAGVYLLMRFFPVIALSPAVLFTVATVGAVTSFFAALSALVQRDIKRLLAYSTISQVAYMFIGVGAGDIVGGTFHLLSHAFFKALLFLAAGCLIYTFNEHNIFALGNYRFRRSLVFWSFLAGAISLSAIPPAAGFFSKDRILLALFIHPDPAYRFLWGLAMATAILTPLYIFKIIFVVFLRKPREKREMPARPIPRIMLWTLWPLLILSLLGGLMNLPPTFSGGEWLAGYLRNVPGALRHLPAPAGLELGMEILGGLLSAGVLVLAYFLYGAFRMREEPAWAALKEAAFRTLYSGFHLDNLYRAAFVQPYRRAASFLWMKVDEGGIDRGWNQLGTILYGYSIGLRLWTTGRLTTYLRMLLLGFTALLAALALGWQPWP